MKDLKKQIQEAVDLYQSGNLKESERLCIKLIETNKPYAFLYNLLGLILADQKRINEALVNYEKGLKVDSKFAMIYNNLGLLYARNKDLSNNFNLEKAINYYKKSITLNKNIPEPHNNLGTLYSTINKIEEAISFYKKAVEINPKFSIAFHNLGNAFMSLGKFDDAKENFEKAIEISPSLIIAHRSLSRIIKYTPKTKHLNQLLKFYNDTKIKNMDAKMDLSFSLGKAYEDVKEYTKSFNFFMEANSIYRKSISFSLKEEVKKFEEIKNIYNSELINKYNNIGFINSSPIFIVGMPRSGTTLIEQIISSHSDVFGGDEIEILPKISKKKFGDNELQSFSNNVVSFSNQDLFNMGKEYHDNMIKISNNSKRFTDKLPSNFLLIGLIKIILPNAKIINCMRSAKDNCFSIFKNHFTSGKVTFAYDLEEITQYYNLYKNLMSYWNRLLPKFIYNIKYENIISNLEIETKNLLRFCNLPWEDNCLNFHHNKRPIKTASDVQARRKIYNTSIGSWKNYSKYLEKYFSKLDT